MVVDTYWAVASVCGRGHIVEYNTNTICIYICTIIYLFIYIYIIMAKSLEVKWLKAQASK